MSVSRLVSQARACGVARSGRRLASMKFGLSCYGRKGQFDALMKLDMWCRKLFLADTVHARLQRGEKRADWSAPSNSQEGTSTRE